MTLPKHADELCYSTDVFLEEGFAVDDFVNQCRKRVTIECLRDDLDAYYRTLKSAMVELINKDYADFVNLSANLVGVDKSIDGLASPLTQLREEVLSIKEAMDAAILAMETKLAQRADIRAKKAMLKRLVVVMESLESLERLLNVRRKSRPLSPASTPTEEKSEIEQLAEREDFAAVVLERVTGEFNRLQFNVSQTQDHPLVTEITPRIADVTSALQSRLEQLFQEALGRRDREGLTHCLQAYASICRQEDAETMFQAAVVHPFLDKVVTSKALVSGSGLTGIYSQILAFFPKQCSLLLELTHPRPPVTSAAAGGGSPQPPRVHGFSFLVNAMWPEVVAVVDERIPAIFAPGNPNNFHKNYTATMEFMSSYEGLCPTQASVRRLRTHPSFTLFLSKWSLPVYFQIRFQEIAGAMENALSLNTAQDRPAHQTSGPAFKLEVFHVLWDCLHRCWSREVFLPSLTHRFWKLSLQLVIRTTEWLTGLHSQQNVSSTEKSTTSSSASATGSGAGSQAVPTTVSLTVPQNLHLIHDCRLFAQQVKQFFSDFVTPKLSLEAMKSPALVQDCMAEVVGVIEGLVPLCAEGITSQVAQACCRNLEPAHTIPRLYRRTNREVPQMASSYVGNILRPLLMLRGEVPADFEKHWTSCIVETVTKRYHEITSEVLTSVKRTEDSLLKLRRNRQSLLPTSGMSDDNKIRLQIALDIETFCSKVQGFGGVARGSSPSLSQLLETGRAAKTLAQTASSSSSSS